MSSATSETGSLPRRTLAAVTAVSAMIAMLVLAAAAAAADPVVNPSPPGPVFNATVTGGSLKVGTLDEIDVGEMTPAPRLRNVSVDENGDLSAAAADFVFPQLVYPVDVPVLGKKDVFIQLRAVQPVTGSIDPATGEVRLNTALTIQLTSNDALLNLGGNCYVGTPSNPIPFSGEAGAAKGVPYDEYSGELTLVEDVLAIPKATGCPTILGQDVTAMINDMLGLPSPSGENRLELTMRFRPGPHSENWVDPDGPEHIDPVIVNDTPVEVPNRGTFRSWLESFTINGNDSRKFMSGRKGNTVRLSLLVKHDPGRTVTGLKIDDDWDANDDSDGATVKPVVAVQPVVHGGFNYSRVTFEYQAPLTGMGVDCPDFPNQGGGTMNRIRDLSVRAVLDNDNETASSSSKIAISRDDCDWAREDAPMVWDWQPPSQGGEVEPGESVTFQFRLGDTDETLGLWTRAGGFRWRWRNLDTGDVTSPIKTCAADEQNGAWQTVNTTAPATRGRWVAEAELINLDAIGPGCTHIQLSNYWFWLGAIDVNSPQNAFGTDSPRVNSLAVPARPETDGSLPIALGAEDPLDIAGGGRVQAVEWDLDGDDTNGVDGYEVVRLGDSRDGMGPGQTQILLETADMDPGIYPVRVRVGDNGALGAADSIRRTTTAESQYMVNTPPTAQNLAVTTEYGNSVATPLVAADTNADGSHDPLRFSLATPPAHGFLSGEWPSRTYHPDSGFSGTDTFTFKVDDGFGGTAEGTVTVTVKPKPATPGDPDDSGGPVHPGNPELAPLRATFPEGRMNLNEGAGPSTSGVKVVDSTVPDTPVVFDTQSWNWRTGAINAPASDLSFPVKTVQMSVTNPIPLDLEVKIELGAIGPITGSFSPNSGAMKLNLNAHALITITASGGNLQVMTCDVTPMAMTLDSSGATLVDPGEGAPVNRPAKNWKPAPFKAPSRDGAVTSLWNSLPRSTALSEPMAPVASCAGTLDDMIGGKGGIWLGGKVAVSAPAGGKPNTNPPNNVTAIFDGKRLHIRLKCGPQYRPRCNMAAVPVTRKDKVRKVRRGKKVRRKVKRGKPMAKAVKKRIKAGKWIKVSFLIKPKYRKTVLAMSKKKRKTLYVRQKVRSKKLGRKKFKGKKPRTVWHRYIVRTAG